MLLKDHEEVVIVLEGFVDFDDLRVVESAEDGVLGENAGWILDELLFDALDSPHGVGVIFHFGLVDSRKGPAANYLAYHGELLPGSHSGP